jgi:hypothetical protein
MSSTSSKSKNRRKRKGGRVSITGRKAFTVTEFCDRHGLSRAFYYGTLKKEGKTPRVTNIGAKQFITEEDETAWRRAVSEEASA